MTTLPHIAGLDWTPDGAIYTATPTKEFWDHYFRPSRTDLLSIGVTVKKTDAWTVRFDPSVASPETVTAVATRLRERSFAAQMTESERRLAAEKWRREQDEKREARLAELEVRRAQDQADAQQAGRACLEKWGEFTHLKAKVRTWSDAEWLPVWEIRKLVEAVQHTERKAARKLQDAAQAEGGVDWSDDLVAAAIRYLTADDADHAAARNNVGWSSADSSTGHWCNAVLDTEPALAIAVGRLLVARYERQLKPLIDGFGRGKAA